MQLGRHLIESSPRSQPTQNTRKRSLATDKHTFLQLQLLGRKSNTDISLIHPAKVPRSGSVNTPREAMRAFGSSSKKHLSGAQGGRHGSGYGKNKKARQPKGPPVLTLPRENDPIHDAEYINRVHRKVPLKKAWEQNPKSPLSNFLDRSGASPPIYQHEEVSIHGNHGWRQV